MTLVLYSIKFDTDQNPEEGSYLINRDAITLADIKRTFPIQGAILFRTKLVMNKNYYWLDLLDDSAIIDKFNNVIHIHALQIGPISYPSSVKIKTKKIIKKKVVKVTKVSNKETGYQLLMKSFMDCSPQFITIKPVPCYPTKSVLQVLNQIQEDYNTIYHPLEHDTQFHELWSLLQNKNSPIDYQSPIWKQLGISTSNPEDWLEKNQGSVLLLKACKQFHYFFENRFHRLFHSTQKCPYPFLSVFYQLMNYSITVLKINNQFEATRRTFWTVFEKEEYYYCFLSMTLVYFENQFYNKQYPVDKSLTNSKQYMVDILKNCCSFREVINYFENTNES